MPTSETEAEPVCEHGETEPHAFMERHQRSCELPEGWCEGPWAVLGPDLDGPTFADEWGDLR